jgi:hypothetical protein
MGKGPLMLRAFQLIEWNNSQFFISSMLFRVLAWISLPLYVFSMEIGHFSLLCMGVNMHVSLFFYGIQGR